MKSFTGFLNELNVGAAFKKGGLKGAVHALKHNIRHRGLVGGTVGDTAFTGGADVGGVHRRIGREGAARGEKPERTRAKQERVFNVYKDRVNREHRKSGYRPAFPERKTPD